MRPKAEEVRAELAAVTVLCAAARGAARQPRLCGDALPELLGESDEKSFGAADVAEPVRLLVLNHVADELRASLTEPGERLVDVVHSEHDA